jgi:hypothetical protein
MKSHTFLAFMACMFGLLTVGALFVAALASR